jgi:geranylgeranyl diphosphate synthase type II
MSGVIERELRQSVPSEWDIPDSLRESMMYSLMAGGKRLRPVLVLAGAESIGGSLQAALPAAIAVELVHTYSLIHDDLPAMDNDDFRRGKPTNHKVYGEAMAILAGDALLTHAFYTIVQSSKKFGLSAEQTLAIVEELSEFAGPRGMVGGQAADILGVQGITDGSRLEYIHKHKTGDMIVFSLRAGARTAGANERQLDALTEFGYQIGLAFQIQDDLLDLTGDEQVLGKPTNSDVRCNKVTYPYLYGIDASRNKIRELTDMGKAAVVRGGIPYPQRLLQIADYLMNRDR